MDKEIEEMIRKVDMSQRSAEAALKEAIEESRKFDKMFTALLDKVNELED